MKKIIIATAIFIILSITFLLYPKFKRVYLWNQFSASTPTAQSYWLFRQKFSPGTIEINDQVIDLQETFHLNKLTDPQTALATYNSPHLQATDYLVSLDSTPSSNTITQISPNKFMLTYAFTIADMRQVFGLFNFTSEELKLMENHYWLTQALIIL